MPELREAIRDIYKRLFPEDCQPFTHIGHDETAEVPPPPESEMELTYQEKLKRQLDAILSKKVSSVQGATSKLTHIDDEIALAAKTAELTSKLQQLHKALSSIPAASIESERVFSVAGSFATKIRSRLSDKTLDHFSFAKCRLKNEKLKKVVNIPISWIFLLVTDGFTMQYSTCTYLPIYRYLFCNSSNYLFFLFIS